MHELDEVFGAQAQKEFWMKLDDLAHDIAALLEILQGESLEGMPGVPTSRKEAVFLAETTADLKEQREAIRRICSSMAIRYCPREACRWWHPR